MFGAMVRRGNYEAITSPAWTKEDRMMQSFQLRVDDQGEMAWPAMLTHTVRKNRQGRV